MKTEYLTNLKTTNPLRSSEGANARGFKGVRMTGDNRYV